ncbi:MAG: hypothetical protein QXD51_00530, partial [Candidatus Anstonellales archaeon]
MAEIGDWVIVTLSSGLELSATKRDEGKWYIYYRDKNGNLVQLTDEWGNQIYLEITSAGRKAIRNGEEGEEGIIEKALKDTTPSLSEDGNTYYIGIGSYKKGGDIYAYNYMGIAKIQKDNVSITTTTTTTQGPELTGGAKGEEKAD